MTRQYNLWTAVTLHTDTWSWQQSVWPGPLKVWSSAKIGTESVFAAVFVGAVVNSALQALCTGACNGIEYHAEGKFCEAGRETATCSVKSNHLHLLGLVRRHPFLDGERWIRLSRLQYFLSFFAACFPC